MRVRVVSRGWTARTDAAPAIQPAQRSTQNSFVIARAVREADGTRGGGRGNQSITAVDPDAAATRVPVERGWIGRSAMDGAYPRKHDRSCARR
mmetsp:Transcript_12910/g.54662  ORF Transcript_12910/g.54662 Transcript_12910/m.54662 type:complete len:93 (-) Transcript_12910:36-314(-)